jgi:Zn-dependent protease with chaperone function
MGMASLKHMTSYFLLVPLNFLMAGGLVYGLNWLAAISWRKTGQAHWTERARLAWPVRRAGATNIFLVPLCLSLAEVATGQVTLAGGAVPAIAGLLGAILGTFPLDREILPRFTFRSWFRLVSALWTLRLAFLAVFVAGGILMPEEPGVAMAVIGGGVFLFIVAWNLGLFTRVLRCVGVLRVPPGRLREIVGATARRMSVREPTTWLLDVPVAYAAALPSTGELLFSTRLLDISSDEEISAICAHELAHLTESKSVLAVRLVGSMTFYPVIFARPAVHFGLSGMGVLVGSVVLSMVLTRKLSRRMEKRADQIATENQGQEGVYARALEKLYSDSLIPAVGPSDRQIHPHLYDRMMEAGIQPEYPRPPKPKKMVGPSLILWLAYAFLFWLALRKMSAS